MMEQKFFPDLNYILHEYEENEPSHSYCTIIVRKNLTAVLKGRDS